MNVVLWWSWLLGVVLMVLVVLFVGGVDWC